MGSIDQILLLQKKVNTAVEKIRQMNDLVSQLKSENDALRRKCAELTNSLEDKTELVSSMEAEQIQIEESIKRALDQLDEVENSVLAVGAQSSVEADQIVDSPQVKEEDASVEAMNPAGTYSMESSSTETKPVESNSTESNSKELSSPESNSIAEENTPPQTIPDSAMQTRMAMQSTLFALSNPQEKTDASENPVDEIKTDAQSAVKTENAPVTNQTSVPPSNTGSNLDPLASPQNVSAAGAGSEQNQDGSEEIGSRAQQFDIF